MTGPTSTWCRRVSLVIWAVVALGTAGSARDASAVEPAAQGWWTVAHPSSASDGGALPVEGAPLAPGVPDDGLLVEGGPSGPNAYAALRFDLPADSTAQTLRLTVADGGMTLAGSAVIACVLVASFTPAQGGPMTAAPAYDCASIATGAVDGSTYTFDVAPLVRDSALAIALLPADPSDRIAFERPGADSLDVAAQPSQSSSPSAPDDGSASASDNSASASDATPSTFEIASPPAVAPDFVAAEPAVDTSMPSVLPAVADELVQPAATAAIEIGSGSTDGIPLPVLVIGALVAMGLWFLPSRLSQPDALDPPG